MRDPLKLRELHLVLLARLINLHDPKLFNIAIASQIKQVKDCPVRFDEVDQRLVNFEQLVKGFRGCNNEAIKRGIREVLLNAEKPV